MTEQASELALAHLTPISCVKAKVHIAILN